MPTDDTAQAITATTLLPTHCQAQPALPQLLRLGKTQEGGAPVLMPQPYASSVRLVPHKSTGDAASQQAAQQALQTAEQWALQLLLQAPPSHLEIFVYDTGLDTSLPLLERLAGAVKARGLPKTIQFISDADSLQTQLEFWMADARQRKSHLLQSGHADWLQLLKSESGQPLRLVIFTRTDDLTDMDRRLATLPDLVQQGPRLGYWFWIVGSAQTPASLRSPPEREQWRRWFDERISPGSLRFGIDHAGSVTLPNEWKASQAAQLYAEYGAICSDPVHPADQQAVFDLFLAKYATPAAAQQEDFWTVAIGKFQGQAFQFRVGPRSGAYHAMLAGTTGTGKTSFLNLLIARTCEAFAPTEFRFFLIDLLQAGSFGLFEGVPHVEKLYMHQSDFGPVLQTLRDLMTERNRRAALFRSIAPAGLVPNVQAYNRLAWERSLPILPCLAVVIDEAQKLFTEGNNDQRREATRLIEEVAREGRAYGFMLLLSSQSFIGVDLPRAAQNQFRLRLALGLTNEDDCRKLLGSENNNLAPLKLPEHHLLVNADSGNLVANRVVALDHLNPEAIHYRMQAVREKYPAVVPALPVGAADSAAQDTKPNATTPAADTAAAVPGTGYTLGKYAAYLTPPAIPNPDQA